LVAGCSPHSVHGAGGGVLYGLGDYLRVDSFDPEALNELGLLFLVTVEPGRLTRLEAIPLALQESRTRLADRAEAAWVTRHFRAACAGFGTELEQRDGHLIAAWHPDMAPTGSSGGTSRSR
jgi:poly-gamma-glutamate synthesis protein (capsule biosynthesis protein)